MFSPALNILHVPYFTAFSFHSFLHRAFVFILVTPSFDRLWNPRLEGGNCSSHSHAARGWAEIQSPDASHTSLSPSAPWGFGGGIDPPPFLQLSRQVSVYWAPAPPFAAASGRGWVGTLQGRQLSLHGDERTGGPAEGEASFSPAGSPSAPWCPVSPLWFSESLMKPPEARGWEISWGFFFFSFLCLILKGCAPIHNIRNPSGLLENENSTYVEHLYIPDTFIYFLQA